MEKILTDPEIWKLILQVIIAILTLIGGASVTAAAAPKPSENAPKVSKAGRKAVDIVACNWGNARNETPSA